MNEREELLALADAGLRHADGLSAQLEKPDWKPSRAHVEQARNSIRKLSESLRTGGLAQGVQGHLSLREEFVEQRSVWRIVRIVPEHRVIVSSFRDRESAEAAFKAELAASPAQSSWQPDERAEDFEQALQKIVQWSEAYPLDIFPEPDWKKASALLNAGGITMDAVSAHCMRHVVEGVGKIARDALSLTSTEGK